MASASGQAGLTGLCMACMKVEYTNSLMMGPLAVLWLQWLPAQSMADPTTLQAVLSTMLGLQREQCMIKSLRMSVMGYRLCRESKHPSALHCPVLATFLSPERDQARYALLTIIQSRS